MYVCLCVCVTLSLRACRKSINLQLELDRLCLPSDGPTLWPSKGPQTTAWDCLQICAKSALPPSAQVFFFFRLWLIFCASLCGFRERFLFGSECVFISEPVWNFSLASNFHFFWKLVKEIIDQKLCMYGSLQPAWPAGPVKKWAGAGEKKYRKKRARGCEKGTEQDHHNQSSMILEEHHLSSFLAPLLLLPPSFSHFLWYSHFDLAYEDSLQSFITFKAFNVRGHKKMLRNGFLRPFTRRSVPACE